MVSEGHITSTRNYNAGQIPATVLIYSRHDDFCSTGVRVLKPRPGETTHESESHLTMQVVNHIRAMIEDGTLKPGEKIPPEREFAQKLKISRASLRTGIGYMAAMGIMKVRHGVGTFITRSLGQASLADHGPLQHELRAWLAKARIAGLTEPGIEAMIHNTFRESAEQETK